MVETTVVEDEDDAVVATGEDVDVGFPSVVTSVIVIGPVRVKPGTCRLYRMARSACSRRLWNRACIIPPPWKRQRTTVKLEGTRSGESDLYPRR